MWRPVMCPPKAEKAPPSSELTCTGSCRNHARLHRRAKHHDFVELLGVRQRFINALVDGLENYFLMNGFVVVRNLLRCARQRGNGNHGETTEYTGGADNYLAPTGRIGLRWPIFLTLNHSPAYRSLMHRFLHDLDFSY